jgi:hypothetical protein
MCRRKCRELLGILWGWTGDVVGKRRGFGGMRKEVVSMSRGCCGEWLVINRGCGDGKVMLWVWTGDGMGKRRRFGGMKKEVVGMRREYFRISRGCCVGWLMMSMGY